MTTRVYLSCAWKNSTSSIENIFTALPTLAVIHLMPGFPPGASRACTMSISAAMSTCGPPSSRDRARSIARAEPIARDGLEQIVDRAFVEGSQRVLLVGRDEDHLAVRARRARHFQTTHAGHADVEERDLRPVLFERFQRRQPVFAFGNDAQLRPQLREQRAQLLSLRQFRLRR